MHLLGVQAAAAAPRDSSCLAGCMQRNEADSTRTCSTSVHWPVLVSHTRAVASLLTLTALLPSAVRYTAFTPPLCTRCASLSPRCMS